jgi:cation transport ATPase
MDSSMELSIRSADDLHLLPYAVCVSRLARSLVRFNITLALGLKLLLAAGAVGGVVTLMSSDRWGSWSGG